MIVIPSVGASAEGHVLIYGYSFVSNAEKSGEWRCKIYFILCFMSAYSVFSPSCAT